MVTTLEHGITIHSSAGGVIVQQAEVTNKREKSTVSGMVNGKCEIVKVFDYGETNEFDVTGKGDLTMAAGITSTADLALISSGVVMIDEFKYTQKINEPSEWSYKGVHYPHAD